MPYRNEGMSELPTLNINIDGMDFLMSKLGNTAQVSHRCIEIAMWLLFAVTPNNFSPITPPVYYTWHGYSGGLYMK